MLEEPCCRIYTIVWGCWEGMFRGEPVRRKHDPALRDPRQVGGSRTIHPRAAKGEGAAVNPNHGSFGKSFPGHDGTSPSFGSDDLKLPSPRSRVQPRRHLNGQTNLLGRCMRHIPTKQTRRTVGGGQPFLAGPPIVRQAERLQGLFDGMQATLAPSKDGHRPRNTGRRYAVPSSCSLWEYNHISASRGRSSHSGCSRCMAA